MRFSTCNGGLISIKQKSQKIGNQVGYGLPKTTFKKSVTVLQEVSNDAAAKQI